MVGETELGANMMLAGVRHVAWGTAMVMAGFLAVMVANCVWIVFFRLETYILFNPWEGWLDVDNWPGIVSYALCTQSLLSLAVVIWLIGHVVWGASKAIAAGRV